MSRTLQIATLLFASVVLLILGCSSKTPDTLVTEGGTSSTDGDTTSNTVTADTNGLKALFTKLQEAIRSRDSAAAATITKSFFPDGTSLRKAIKDSAAIEKIKTMHAQFSDASDDQTAKLFATDANRTEIIVHSATTEEIIAYEEGGTAYDEFPGGAKAAAETVLQPRMTFYEVELVEPGKDRGMKYHLFYHDGQNWKMLGPIWRALR